MSNYIGYTDLLATHADPVSDTFDSPTGQWINYYAYGTDGTNNVVDNLNKQSHTDIRSFEPASTVPQRVIDLSTKKVGGANGISGTVLSLSQSASVAGETWTNSTIGKSSQGWNQLSVSVSTTPTTASSTTNLPIDISSFDYITVAMPSLPDGLNCANSKITFSDGTTSVDVPFTITPGTGEVSAVANTNSELRFNISRLGSTITKSAIKTVSFTLVMSSGTGTFKCLGIRAISSNWKYASIDINTITKRVIRTVPPNGVHSSYTFGSSTGSTKLETSPVFIRALNNALSNDDPKVIDGSMTGFIYTGKTANATSASPNSIGIYFRVAPALTSQTTLDTKTQSYLNAIDFINPKSLTDLATNRTAANVDFISTKLVWYKNSTNNNPIFNIEIWNNSSTSALYTLPVDNTSVITGVTVTTDGTTSATLSDTSSLKPNTTYYIYSSTIPIENHITFTTGDVISSTTVTLSSSTGVTTGTTTSCVIDPSINPLLVNSKLAFCPTVEDNSVLVRLYRQDPATNKFELIYTNKIINDVFYKNRGRIGWGALFNDADVYLDKIRSQGLTYSKYKTSPMSSITPIKGAQIFPDASPPHKLFQYPYTNSFGSWTNSTTSVADYDKNKPNISTKVTCIAGKGLQGIQSTNFNIEDVEDININFKIWFPNIDSSIIIFLYNNEDNVCIPITTPHFNRDQWSKINLEINDFIISGSYKLVILQSSNENNTTWWISEPTIEQNQIIWEGRASAGGSLKIDPDMWINFGKSINLTNGAANFVKSGKEFQIQGRAKTPYASIKSVKVQPTYATLGNFVWRD